MRVATWAAAFVLFTVLATANAGGYRYGVSDQAFYIPAISLRADPTLFAHDRDVFEPQMRLWLGDEILGAVVRTTAVPLPVLFGGLYLVTMAVYVAGAGALARAFGLGPLATLMALLIMTLRHRIPKTGANSLEGYMHPRVLAFGLGLFVLAAVLRRRWLGATALVLVAALVHPSTAMWFAGVVLVAWLASLPQRTWLLVTAAAFVGAAPSLAPRLAPGFFVRMDPDWLAVLGDRDYLFSLAWPLYAWVLNLGYVALLVLLYRYRRAKGLATPAETGLVVGLLALVVVFLSTLPATDAQVAFFVTLQANRVFWLLDAVLAIVGAWWMVDALPAFTHRRAAIVVMALVAMGSAARGVYVLQHETNRALVEPDLPPTTWTATMRWLETQPASWNVLADPAHAWKFGSSIRAAARRSTPLELGKDPAMAMYDRALARRVADRERALQPFDHLTIEDVRRLDATYSLDVLIDVATRRFDLPVLFANDDFVAYDLR